MFSWKFLQGYPDWEALEEGQKVKWPKCYNNNRKGEDIINNVNNGFLSPL